MDSEIDEVMGELEFDLMIRDMTTHILPLLTHGQLDALRHACEVEINERFSIDLFATTPEN